LYLDEANGTKFVCSLPILSHLNAMMCLPPFLPRRVPHGCWLYILATCVVIPIVVGCGHSESHAPSAKPMPDDAVTAALQAELFAVEPRTWPTIVRAQGSLIADEVTTVGAKVAGRVLEVHVDLGDEVRQGTPLITLDRREFELQVTQAEAQLSQVRAAVGLRPGDLADRLEPPNAPPSREAKAIWDEAVTQLERQRELRVRNASSEVEFDQAAAAERVAEARYASALNGVREKLALISVREAELALASQRLQEAITLAPFDGKIQNRLVAPGTFVQVGQPLVAMVRTGTLRFRGSMPERSAHRLAVGQQVTLRIESSDEPFRLEISRISPALDELSRSLLFEANVSNQDGQLRPGLFAEAELVLDPQATALVVPRSAVVQFAGTEKVWKVVDGLAREQPVRVGRRAGDAVEISSGLAPGDVIVVDGSQGRVARVDQEERGNLSSVQTTIPPPDNSSAADQRPGPTSNKGI
jgi:RND family efflux transporter MFP subunit